MDRASTSFSGVSQSTGVWVLFAAVLAFVFGIFGGLAAGIAVAITGALFWWVIIERPSKLTYRQGVQFGFLAQLAAYPVLFYISGFLGFQAGLGGSPAFNFPSSSSAELVHTLTYGMVVWVGFHSLGVIITGPLGIFGGLILVALRRRFPPSDSESGDT